MAEGMPHRDCRRIMKDRESVSVSVKGTGECLTILGHLHRAVSAASPPVSQIQLCQVRWGRAGPGRVGCGVRGHLGLPVFLLFRDALSQPRSH